ncbi:MAG: hypothetical protein IPN33_00925 [Saprospiraceae bacterium]|nr:hypothetical protein [Saprospiraceae bacterium]
MTVAAAAQTAIPVATDMKPIPIDHAAAFGRLLMQDHMGRIKPMNTFSSEVLRKLSRKESLFGLTADQIILGMAANPQDWYAVPIIKMGKHEEVTKILNTSAKLIAYKDFLIQTGNTS